MLKARVIPTLLWKDLGLVKGKGFDSWRRIGTVLPAIKVYNTREVDELILVDIAATNENTELDYNEIESLTAECFVPLTVGGGIKSIDQVRRVLRSGADKVCLNSSAFVTPDIIDETAKRFGSQCVVASVDARKNSHGSYECASHSGKNPTGREVVSWCLEMERRGAGEILLTSVERDGLMQGYDLELIENVCSQVKIPVIASGGAGEYVHMLEALQRGASAVAAASMFHFTEKTPREAKEFLAQNGIAVRNGQVHRQAVTRA